MKKNNIFAFLVSIAIFLSATGAFAGGPLLLFDSGVPYAWGSTFLSLPIPYLKDPGSLGPLTNAEADALSDLSMAEWNAVATSTFSTAPAGDIPFDVDASNFVSYIFSFHGVVIDVINDDDGSILSNVFGAPPGVLGLGGFVFIFTNAPEPASGLVLMNGAAVNPADAGGSAYRVVFTQEVGHVIGLGHEQTNGAVSFFGDNSGPGGTLAAPECQPLSTTPRFEDFTAMYPFASVSPTGPGAEAASVDHPEDLNSISRFYPAPGYAASTVTIVGTVLAADGVTPVDGVNIVVRNVDDDSFEHDDDEEDDEEDEDEDEDKDENDDGFSDARSTVSGDLSCTSGCVGTGTFADGFTGTFVLTGLTPGQEYSLAVDNIVAGAFAQAPAPVFQEEFWNEDHESNDPDEDDPCDFDLISGSAGEVINITVILNDPALASGHGDDDDDDEDELEKKVAVTTVVALPTNFALQQNYPNPFNPETRIDYQVTEQSAVKIQIFNLSGQLVRELVDEFKEAGFYTAAWDGRDAAGFSAPSGAYFYKMQAGNFQKTRKMVLLK